MRSYVTGYPSDRPFDDPGTLNAPPWQRSQGESNCLLPIKAATFNKNRKGRIAIAILPFVELWTVVRHRSVVGDIEQVGLGVEVRHQVRQQITQILVTHVIRNRPPIVERQAAELLAPGAGPVVRTR